MGSKYLSVFSYLPRGRKERRKGKEGGRKKREEERGKGKGEGEGKKKRKRKKSKRKGEKKRENSFNETLKKLSFW